jgi:hypothetical protein
VPSSCLSGPAPASGMEGHLVLALLISARGICWGKLFILSIDLQKKRSHIVKLFFCSYLPLYLAVYIFCATVNDVVEILK